MGFGTRERHPPAWLRANAVDSCAQRPLVVLRFKAAARRDTRQKRGRFFRGSLGGGVGCAADDGAKLRLFSFPPGRAEGVAGTRLEGARRGTSFIGLAGKPQRRGKRRIRFEGE